MILVAVATFAEALPLWGFHPRVTGMGRRIPSLAGYSALLSAGFAGACDPTLRPGDVLVAGPIEVAAALGAREGELRTVESIASPAEKARLAAEGVAAVDMETAHLAAAGLPFLGVRVIIDDAASPALGIATAVHYPLAARALRRAVRRALAIWP